MYVQEDKLLLMELVNVKSLDKLKIIMESVIVQVKKDQMGQIVCAELWEW